VFAHAHSTQRGIAVAELFYPTSGGGSVTDTKYEQLIGQYGPSGLVGDFNTSQKLVYADSTGRQIKVRPNRAAIVRGYRWETDSAGLTVPIAANSSGQLRYDRAILRLDRTNWTVSFQIIQGTPAASPSVPNYTQTEGTTGYWEIPLARIAVASGATTIAAGDVLNQAFNIGGWPFRGEKAAPPYTTGSGHLFYAVDNARMYAAIDNSWQVIGESGSLVSQGSAASGWSAGNVYYQRWNGFVYCQMLLTRTGGSLAANVDSTLFTIPSVYRMTGDAFIIGNVNGVVARALISGSSGVVTLREYNTTIGTGAALTMHPLVWPANNA
jgi:hypothetical protein